MVGTKCLADRIPHVIPAPPPAALPVGPVTLRDLVSFRPSAGVDRMEPNGWMVVGLDTNFYVEVGVEIRQGLLLGQTASVRFAPVRYHWSYGDGSTADRAVEGGTWASQGVTEFDPTPTSHVYRAKGTYTIDLTVDFTAEYRFGSGAWTPVAGVITVPTNRLTAVAGDAKTVLVERDCAVRPSGPGC